MSFRSLHSRILVASAIFLFVCFSNCYELNIAESDKDKPDTKADVHEFEYTFIGGENINLTLTSPYDDSWFTNNPREYNHDLCLASFAMAVSSFTATSSSGTWGDEACERERNIRQTYVNLGFTNMHFYNYDTTLNDTSSKAAYSFAMRTDLSGRPDVQLINVSVRGGGYGCEWADNFNIGDSSDIYHSGFKNCASDIKNELDKYISMYCQSDSIVLWINGYSRGGAIANILASMYTDEGKHNVYAYTFASPGTVSASSTSVHGERYSTIFNIINPLDPICNIPPEEWGFARFGKDVYLKSDAETNKKVLAEYKALTGRENAKITSGSSNVLLDILKKLCTTTDEFASLYAESTAELIVSVMSREQNSDGKWERIGAREYLIQKYGTKATEAIAASQGSAPFKALEKFDIKLPEEIIMYNAILRLHGHYEPEEAFMKVMTLENLDMLIKLKSGDIGFEEVVGHYPETYISMLRNFSGDKLQ